MHQLHSKHSYIFDVRGSVHHSKIHKEKSNEMQQCIKFLLFHIYIELNMFRATYGHHQKPKTALAASGFPYAEGCWTCSWWTFPGTAPDNGVPDNVHQLHVQQASTYEKPEAASAVLGS
jgi:hypothetical protein